MKPMTLREALVFLFTVAGLLMADVLLRAIFGGYDAARLGGFDVACVIGTTVILLTRTRLGSLTRG